MNEPTATWTDQQILDLVAPVFAAYSMCEDPHGFTIAVARMLERHLGAAPQQPQSDCNAALRAAPAGQHVWTSVGERWPDEEVDVLVRMTHGGSVSYTVAGIFQNDWMSCETQDDTKGEVTHWMPLPKWPQAAVTLPSGTDGEHETTTGAPAILQPVAGEPTMLRYAVLRDSIIAITEMARHALQDERINDKPARVQFRRIIDEGTSSISKAAAIRPAPVSGTPSDEPIKLTTQQVADRIADKGVMSPHEFRAFLNGDSVEMWPEQIAAMCSLFAPTNQKEE